MALQVYKPAFSGHINFTCPAIILIEKSLSFPLRSIDHSVLQKVVFPPRGMGHSVLQKSCFFPRAARTMYCFNV